MALVLRKQKEASKLSHLSIFGTTQIHLRNPYIIAMWSVMFPGYGHLLLNKYLRGFSLVIWELFINQSIHLNSAMVYSFIGEIEKAKEVLDVRYMHLYIPVYIFAIWDSYRTTVDMNKIYLLNEKDAAAVERLVIKPFEINYLDKRNPLSAIMWSVTIPSLGQLYIHRIFAALFTLVMTVILVHFSHFIEAFHYLLVGELKKSTQVLNAQWLMYLPSFYFFTIYDSYMNVVENNKLYDSEQKRLLRKFYQSKSFIVKKGIKVK
ncbi:hypothetical protein M4D56_14685 [Cytobacillus oceanisediminis]|uniref:hypothetical protein n=1 Tax=Cytobacillus TaxID=2675230 RepID=UPI00203C66BD|nr:MULTISPECIES: hypothetical protein [Cytobacillus]MCM3530324.1 hypothetical protein [Cytobacillus oceanisediminis]UQX55004.1 hypothetical protein M5V91_04295 [Cytobacillus pseudoceanisediminis]